MERRKRRITGAWRGRGGDAYQPYRIHVVDRSFAPLFAPSILRSIPLSQQLLPAPHLHFVSFFHTLLDATSLYNSTEYRHAHLAHLTPFTSSTQLHSYTHHVHHTTMHTQVHACLCASWFSCATVHHHPV